MNKFALILCLLLGRWSPLLAADACCAVPPEQEKPVWRAQSLFHLPARFQSSGGKEVSLPDLRGAPVLISMFYASCPTVCPRMITEIRAIEAQLEPEQAKRLRVVLVSFDPERDTPEALAKFAENWKMDPARWQLWTGTAADVRTLSAALGIRYRKESNGQISHSAPLILLNADGEIDHRLEDLGHDRTEWMKRMRTMLDG